MKAKRVVSKFSTHFFGRLHIILRSCNCIILFYFSWCNQICNVGHFLLLLLKKNERKSCHYWVVIL
uniref:Uncharacterized protein n=1 Tax=Arundo donax TaxID=35708 RepID=A0A0A9HJB5_ARUDO